MSGHRTDRLNEDITRELCAIIRRLKDPRISSLLSVVRVDVTNDLSYATCYVSAMEGMDATKRSVQGLKSAAGYIRRELGNSLSLRYTPELRFVADDSIEHSAKINSLLRSVIKEEPTETDSDGDEQE